MPVPRLDRRLRISSPPANNPHRAAGIARRTPLLADRPATIRCRRLRPMAVCSTAPVRLRRYRATYRCRHGQRSLSGIMPSSSNAQVSSSPIRVLVRARCGRAANSISHDLGQRLSSITNERISASRIDKVSRMPTANAAIVSRPRSVFPASRQDSHSSNGSATQSALACCAPRSRRSLRNSCDLVSNSSKPKGSVCSAACRLACRLLARLVRRVVVHHVLLD